MWWVRWEPIHAGTDGDVVSTREFSSNELSTVGNYTLGKLVGKGTFGRVYLATHKLTNGTKV